MAKDFASYYDVQFSESLETGSIYEPFTPLLEAAHNQRIELLDKLPLGDLSDKVVVDFGTGSWGFACVFEKLHDCKLAIGIDISAQAVAISEQKSRAGNFAYGNRFKYLVSDGNTLPLETGSVDVFFTGECIEHVENTDAFLDEIYRVMRPGGILILTTPNPQPWFYRIFGMEYAVGPEHIALMTYDELNSYLAPRFDVLEWQGYNASIHPDIDGFISNPAIAQTWARACRDNPRDACGFVVMAKARPGYRPHQYERNSRRLTSSDVRRRGVWEEMGIHKELSAHMTKAGGELSMSFTGSQLVVLMWAHDWSGIARISVDDDVREADLYCAHAGFRRLVFAGLDPHAPHRLEIAATGRKNPLSHDDQVLFFSASSFQTV
ncbi:class I SAM-dependent methyltransferase [Burkholderia gladioli]|jgi:SAM-dependent methyltransferase|uniref:class I SAM-dependent methyltransferase n=1 Tax=Burkholderia gladioli TaxID=28095 RepID=UPI00163EED65|nr:class I SAM-dependent methyltransferase [Burkholderia gladioli]MDN7718702.1 class I SAM-dependent methyltransferase [Burkholderia gladioli]